MWVKTMTERTVTPTLHGRIEPIPGDCPTCGFEALRWMRVYHLTTDTIGIIHERLYCGRCKAEENQ